MAYDSPPNKGMLVEGSMAMTVNHSESLVSIKERPSTLILCLRYRELQQSWLLIKWLRL